MKKIKIIQVSRVESTIFIDVPDDQVQSYLDGDFEVPTTDDRRWAQHWDLQNEEISIHEGPTGFQPCPDCGSLSLRCGCD